MNQKWREATAKYRAHKNFSARIASLAKELEAFFTGEEVDDAKDLLEAGGKWIRIATISEDDNDAQCTLVFLDENGLQKALLNLDLPLGTQDEREHAVPFSDFQKLAEVLSEKQDPEKALPKIRVELDWISKHADD